MIMRMIMIKRRKSIETKSNDYENDYENENETKSIE